MVKENGKYRYSLQFNGSSDKNKRVGVFLDKLGNRKSAVIVDAVTEYLENHPEKENALNIKVSVSTDETALRQMISDIISERLEGLKVVAENAQTPTTAEITDEITADVEDMLANFDLFM